MAASKKLLCDFADCQQGTIAIVSAVLLTVIMGSSALGVDLASVYFQKRIAQGVVDLAAMNAASHPDRADEAVAATIDANRLAGVHRIEIHKGFYAADRAVAAANRFKPDAAPVNAVRVTFRSLAPLYFASALGFDEAPISVSATAGTSNAATFSVGSRLASLNGGLANSLLSALTGSTVSLSAMDYRALVNADIRVDGFLNSIAERAHITAGTYRDVLDAKLTMGEVAGAVASRLRVDGNGDAALSVERFAGQVSGSSRKLQIKSLVGASDYANITVGRTHPGLGALLSVFEVMRAAAVLSNGKRQVTVDLELGIPGISRSELTLAIGEPAQYSAWASVGQSGALVRTAQTKLRLVNTIDAPAGLGIASITLPIFAEAAYADAALDSVRCGSSGRDRS